MIAESPQVLLLSLAATTVLGGIMGFCIALLRAKGRAKTAIDKARIELGKISSEAESELETALGSISNLQGTASRHHERANKSAQREEALELHSQLQAQRISRLEAQLATYEDQQIRLQRDFASYKSNKSRELELARNSTESWSQADSLPVLSKRIESDPAQGREPEPSIDSPEGGRLRVSGRRRNDRDRLSKPLSRELEIPALTESELPDSVDGLEFELVDMDGTGAWPRG